MRIQLQWVSTLFFFILTWIPFNETTAQSIGDEWFEVLGKNFADRSIQPNFLQFTEERTPLKRTDGRLQISWLENGLSVLVTERGLIEALFFINEGYELQKKDFKRFTGDLPMKLSWDMSPVDIEKVLGEPTEKALGQTYGRIFYRTNYDITILVKENRMEYVRIALVGK